MSRQFGTTILIPIALASGVCKSPGQSSTQTPDQLVGELAQGPSSLGAQQALLELPPETVVPSVVRALQSDPEFRRDAPRYLAYNILLNARAAKIPGGLDQLLVGLRDPVGQADCVSALRLAPSESHARVVSALDQLLDDRDTQDGVKQHVAETLGKLGGPAKLAVPKLMAIVKDRTANETLRSNALYAVLSIDGAEKSREMLAEIRAENDRAALWAIGRFGGETNGTFGVAGDQRPAFRSPVLAALGGSSPEIRKAALQVVVSCFGDDACSTTADGFALNQQLRDALQRVASSDSDEALRFSASQFLTQLAALVAAKNTDNVG